MKKEGTEEGRKKEEAQRQKGKVEWAKMKAEMRVKGLEKITDMEIIA